MRIAIAIDGPGSAGKGVVAKGTAKILGYAYIDTGAMYRAVALHTAQRGVSWDDGEAVGAVANGLDIGFEWNDDDLVVLADGQDISSAIRTGHIGQGASIVSAHPSVRRALLDAQRSMGQAGGVVMDGRDIGTVVMPGAELKIYLDADAEVRAVRRFEELGVRGVSTPLAQVRASLEQRDHRDANRAVAPLRAAEDAVRIDTTKLTIQEAIDAVVGLAKDRLAGLT
jgi:CMP/dCMP kinase